MPTIVCLFIAAFSVVVPAVAVAQTPPGPFALLQSRLTAGERIAIWDGKTEIRGWLTRVSPAEIVVIAPIVGPARRGALMMVTF